MPLTPHPPLTAENLGQQILEQFLARVPQEWRAALSEADMLQIVACCRDAAELQVQAMMTPHTVQEQQNLLAEKQWITAQLMNISTAASVKAPAVLWDIVQDAVQAAAAIAFTAI